MSRPAPAVERALALVSTWDVPNVAAVVVGPAGIVARTGDGARPFRLASVTKLLTAYACLIAVEEGTLDLDEPVEPPGATVRHLLAHAAGYGFNAPPRSPPGRRRTYSNTGIDALGAVLTERAGMDARAYVVAAVLDPLAMTATDLRDRSLAHGAWSTTEDLARFVGELLRPTLIHRSTLTTATTVQFPGLDGVLPGVGPQRPLDWGLGFELRDHKSPHWTGATNSPSTFGHFGGAGTLLWVDPDLDHGLVVLADREFGPWAMAVWPPLANAVVAAVS